MASNRSPANKTSKTVPQKRIQQTTNRQPTNPNRSKAVDASRVKGKGVLSKLAKPPAEGEAKEAATFAPSDKSLEYKVKQQQKTVDLLQKENHQLRDKTVRLGEQLAKAETERLAAQAERENVLRFWHISREQLDQQKTQNAELFSSARRDQTTHEQRILVLLELSNRLKILSIAKERVVLAAETQTAADGDQTAAKNPAVSQVVKSVEVQTTADAVPKELPSSASSRLKVVIERDEAAAADAAADSEACEQLRAEMDRLHETQLATVKKMRADKQRQFDEIVGHHEAALDRLKQAADEQAAQQAAVIAALQTRSANDHEEIQQLSANHESLVAERDLLADKHAELETNFDKLSAQVNKLEKEKNDFKKLHQHLAELREEKRQTDMKRERSERALRKAETERDALRRELTEAARLVEQRAHLEHAVLRRRLDRSERLVDALAATPSSVASTPTAQ